MKLDDSQEKGDLSESVLLPRHALEEGEALLLIQRHLKSMAFPLQIRRKQILKSSKKRHFFFEHPKEENVTTKVIDSVETLEPELTFSSNEVLVLYIGGGWVVSYSEDGLTLQGNQVKRVATTGVVQMETFFEHVVRGAFPIKLAFGLGGTFAPFENVFRFILHNPDWKGLIEDELLPQLQIPKAKNVWQSLSHPTYEQTFETFSIEFHPNILGNFILAHDANDTYYFIDHVNGDIKIF